MAGPRLPPTITLIPDQLKAMARRVQGSCTKSTTYIGGFITGDLRPMIEWLTSPNNDLDKPFPASTSFLTLTISTLQSDWLSPGNYDPGIAQVLALAEFEAAKKVDPSSEVAKTLRGRGQRFLRVQQEMEPRGKRVAWWERPSGGGMLVLGNGGGNGTVREDYGYLEDFECVFQNELGTDGPALGILVDDDKLSWDTKVKDVIPGFRTQSEELHNSATILDFLSMRSGMQQYNPWLQSQNNIIFPRDDGLKIINSLRQTQPLRQGFQYDNWAYEILSHVFPNIVGSDWGVFCSDHLFKPLNLSRTGSRASALDSMNVARAYTVLDDTTPVTVRDVHLSDQTLMGGAGGVRSCVADLLTYYAAFLDAYADQTSSGKTSTINSPFTQVISTTSAHITIPIRGFENQAYAMGWVKGRLPGPLGVISNNFGNLGSNVPEVGRNGPSIATLNHAGSMAGAMTGVILFPESKSAISVLTNTLGLSNTADTVSQLLTEILFDLPEPHDFVALSETITAAERKSMSRVAEKLDWERTLGTTLRDLQDYVGTYQNTLGTMKIEIMLQKSKLAMRFQDLEEETSGLEHEEHDIFTWHHSRNECARRGRFTN
ncbi:MAG: hypothetical protein Q9222_000708 [Ikaeria aurantiellina]